MSDHSAASPADLADLEPEHELKSFGYKQELPRVLRFWTNWALGFAFISPIVGLYTVVSLETQTAGASWVWMLLAVVAGQIILALVLAELSSRWPIAGGIYQWALRLLGPRYGWWTGWIYLWALIVTLSLVAYGGGTFLGNLIGVRLTTGMNLLLAVVMMIVFTGINAVGLRALKYLVYIGITCEIVATLAVGAALIIGFRRQPVSVIVHVATNPASFYTASAAGALLAALAYGGWVILGFDSCGAIAEETVNPRRGVPRAVMMSVISVGIVDLIASLGVLLAQPSLRAAISGTEPDPIGAAVRSGIGGWATTPFLAVVVLGFISCGLAVQAATVRVAYSYARDSMLPFHRTWARVNHRTQTPLNAIFLTGVLGVVIFAYAKTLSVLVGFATGGYFLAFFCPVFAALLVRVRRRWAYAPGQFSLGRLAVPVLVVAVLWSGLEFINIAWPRQTTLPWYENWAVELAAAIIGVIGAVYYFARRPYRHIGIAAEREQRAGSQSPAGG